jgi:hypothetical protein
VPIIRCPRNGAAEAIATMLDTKLHDHLVAMGHLFPDLNSFHRPGDTSYFLLVVLLLF